MSSLPTRGTGQQRSERWRDCLVIASAAILFTLLVRPFQNTPFVDDWVYAWSVENLLEHGRLQVLEYSSNINLTQVLWGWLFCLPFGFSFVALRLSTWFLAVGGLCGLYSLLRDLDVPRRNALLGTATLGVYPIFAMLSVTFMTDVPFVSLTILASFAMVRTLRDRSLWWLVAATVMACLAVAIRTVGLVTPLAMFLALVLGGDGWGRRGRRWALSLLPFIVFAAAVYWRGSHIYQSADLTWVKNTTADRIAMLREFALPLLPRMAGETLALLAGTLGLALLPLSLACIRPGMLRRTFGILVALGLVLAGLHAVGLHYPLPLMTGETWALNELGGTSLLVPDPRVPPVPVAICWAALAIGTLSLASATAAASRLTWKPEQLFLVFAVAGHCALMALLWLISDRYVLVLVPYAIALVLSAGPPLRQRTAVLALVVFAFVTVAGMSDHLRYNRALWQAVDLLQRAGVPERDINGGYMVNGWLQYAHPEHAHRDSEGNLEIPWLNGANELPYKIANSRADGWDVVQSLGYTSWLGPPGHIYVLKAGERGVVP